MCCVLDFLSVYCVFKKYLCLQIADLDSEDGKKDTMVDVVFKKALKEFRINIFNSYSTALAVSPRCSFVFVCSKVTIFSLNLKKSF